MIMGDEGEFWRDVHDARKEKRAANRDDSAALLRDAGIEHLSKNGGAHLIVRGRTGTADFWPGTGLWRLRGSTQQHRGVRKLIKLMTPNAQGEHPAANEQNKE